MMTMKHLQLPMSLNAMQVLKSLLKEHLQATKPELDLEDILAGVQ